MHAEYNARCMLRRPWQVWKLHARIARHGTASEIPYAVCATAAAVCVRRLLVLGGAGGWLGRLGGHLRAMKPNAPKR